MSLLYMVLDPYANFLGRGPDPTTNPEDVDATGLQVSSTHANSDFAPSKLVDRRADVTYMPNAVATSYYVYRNINLVADHAVKIAGNLGPAWTRYTPSAGDAAYQDVVVRAGEKLQIRSTHGTFAGTQAVQVQNLATGNWLNSSGAWVAVASGSLAAGVSVISSVAASTDTFDFTVESMSAFGDTGYFVLRIYIWTSAGSTNIQDAFSNLELTPFVNCAWVYGHNFSNQYIPTLETSSNGSAWTVVSTGAIHQPGLYFSITDTLARWWRIKFTAVPIRDNAVTQPLPGIGEAFVGYASSPVRQQRWGWKERDIFPQLRQKNAAGQPWAYTITSTRMRGLELQFLPYDTPATGDALAALESIRKDIWLRSNGGAYPVAIVARDARPDIVFGMLSESPFEVSHNLPYAQETALSIDPFPPPVVGP